MKYKYRYSFEVWAALMGLLAAGCSIRKDAAAVMSLNATEIQPIEASDQAIIAKLIAAAGNPTSEATAGIIKYSPGYLAHENLVLTVEGIALRQNFVSKVDLAFDIVQELFIYITPESRESKKLPVGQEKFGAKIICRFDSHLSIDDNIASALTLYGAPANGSFGLGKRSLIRQVSQIIQTAPSATGESLAKSCRESYLNNLREVTVSVMSRFAENMTYNMPQQRCDLPKSPGLNSGDDSCLAWFHDRYPELARSAVPRCQETEGLATAYGFCIIRAKYMFPCPIFLNQDLTYIGNPDDGSIQLGSNPLKKQFFCDAERQQHCRARKSNADDLFAVLGTCEVP